VQLDRSGNEVRQAEVVVNEPDRPVLLVLSAYDPVVWNVGVTEGTQVLGVVCSGYHGQAVIGIDEDVPLALATYENNEGGFEHFRVFTAEPGLLRLDDRIAALAGRGLEHLTIAPSASGIFEVGLPLGEGEEVRYSGERSLNDYLIQDLLPAGQYGLDLLEEAGAIRKATMADIDAWIDQESAPFQELAPGIRINSHLAPGFTYVVLEAFEFPAGLFGAHSRTFLVPEGVPAPTGDPGHSTVLQLEAPLEAVAAQLVVAFGDWTGELGAATGVGREDVLAGSDSDGDGCGDLLEFAMASDPMDALHAGTIGVSTVEVEGETFLELSFPLRSNGLGVRAALETSSDGRAWEELTEGFELAGREPLDSETSLVRLRSTAPASASQDVRLFRLRVTAE
jgi:hypothetical protein